MIFENYDYLVTFYTAGLLCMTVKYKWTTASSKISYVSIVNILSDADLHQVEKEVESTLLPDAAIHQVEMIGK